MITAANIPARSPVYFIEFIIEYRPTATGLILSELPNIKKIKYSFQTLIKLKIVTVIIPGCAVGGIINQKVFVDGHPAIAAASSNALDIFANNVLPTDIPLLMRRQSSFTFHMFSLLACFPLLYPQCHFSAIIYCKGGFYNPLRAIYSLFLTSKSCIMISFIHCFNCIWLQLI